jgi:nitric oxide reductase NorD protein
MRKHASTVETTVEACFRIYGELYDAYPLVPYANQRDVRELFAGIGKATVAPELAFDASPELFAVAPQRPRYDDVPRGEERDIDLTSRSRREQGLKRLQKTLVQGSIQVHRYPEWSAEKGLFLDRHCTLFENVVVPGSPDYYRNLVDEYELVYKKMRKRFLYLRNEEVEVSRRWLDGDDIHLGDAVDYAIDLHRGAEANDKIYQVKRQNTRDIAVGILVDCSSSTEEKIGQRRIIDIEKAALSLLASALHLVGDTFGVFTFFSMGRRNVFFNVVKDFSEPWNAVTQARVDSIQAYAGNRDGCAVRHAAGKLLQRPEKTKLLLMLSDGVPADAGYGGASGAETSRYAIEDTRRAILDARAHGIIPYCVTIDRFGKRYIPHLYGERHHCLIDDVVKLPDRMWRLYARLTA